MSRSRMLLPMIAILMTAVNALYAQSQGDIQLPTPFRQAVAAIEQKDYAKAKPLLEQVVRMDSNDVDGWYSLGYVAQELNDDATLLKASKRLAKLKPDRLEAWMWQVVAYNNRRQFDSLVAPAMKVMSLDSAQAAAANLPALLGVLSQDTRGRRDSTFILQAPALSMRLPASWHLRSETSKHSLDWFISLEPIESDSDAFSTGVSAHWYRSVSKVIPVGNKNDAASLVAYWRTDVQRMSGMPQPYYTAVVDSSALRVGPWNGTIVTQDLQVDERAYRLRKFDIVLARKDEVFTIVMECPIDYWSVYEPRFRQALKTIRLPK